MKTSLVLIAVLGLFIGTFLSGYAQDRKSDQQEAIAEITKKKGIIFRAKNGEPVAVVLTDKGVTNETLKSVGKLTMLRALTITGPSGITDDGLKYLAQLQGLENLQLVGLTVGDNGVSNLKDLKNLTELNLAGTQTSDAGLKHLVGLKKLKKLNVKTTKVTSDGVRALQEKLPGVKVER